jgi:hypothetical protein
MPTLLIPGLAATVVNSADQALGVR